MRLGKAGFSVAEILVVVAIVVVLVALSIPKFMIAQLRANMTQCVHDMRAIAESLELYRQDFGAYPPWQHSRVRLIEDDPIHPNIIRLYRLTTPISYLLKIPEDPFVNFENEDDLQQWGAAYDYVEVTTPGQETDPHAWGHLFRLNSWGPNGRNSYAGGREFASHQEACPGGIPRFVFAPSNGLMSYGDIVWVGPRGGPFQDRYCRIINGF